MWLLVVVEIFLKLSVLLLFLLYNVGLVLMLNIEKYINTEKDFNGFIAKSITEIFTAVLTQPMFPILALLYYKSCKDMQNLCNKTQGLPKNIRGHKDVSSNVIVDIDQPGAVRLESMEVENTENSDLIEEIEVANSKENVTSKIEEAKSRSFNIKIP